MSSRRRKSAPKKKDESAVKNDVLKAVQNELMVTQKRFLFNIDQIERKHCRATSGIVLPVDSDEVEWDPDYCTASDDRELTKLLRRQLEGLKNNGKFGASFLSTPAPDPDENDQSKIDKWKKLNKVFENSLKNCLDDSACSEEKENTSLSFVKKPRLSLALTNPAETTKDTMDISVRKIDISQVSCKMLPRDSFGSIIFSSLQPPRWMTQSVPFSNPLSRKRSNFSSQPFSLPHTGRRPQQQMICNANDDDFEEPCSQIVEPEDEYYEDPGPSTSQQPMIRAGQSNYYIEEADDGQEDSDDNLDEIRSQVVNHLSNWR